MRHGIALVTLLTLIACSDSSGGDGRGTVVRDKAGLVGFALRLRDAQCAYYERCAPTLPSGQRYVDECELVRQLPDDLSVMWVLEDDALIAFGAYDRARGDACLRAIAATACTDGSTLREACRNVFVGTLAVGTCCEADDACVPSAYCSYAPQSAIGVCVARPALGEPCSYDAPCADEHACVGGKCAVALPVGAECSDAQPNDEDPCGPIHECAGGRCTRPTYGVAGDACDDAAAKRCLGDLECMAGTCRLPDGVPLGGSCLDADCAPHLRCDDGAGGDDLCHEPVKLGGSCTAGRYVELMVCDAVTSTWRFGRLGDVCQDDSQCVAARGFCDATCVPQRTMGSACERDLQCDGLYCEAGKCGDAFARQPSQACMASSDAGAAGIGGAGFGMPP